MDAFSHFKLCNYKRLIIYFNYWQLSFFRKGNERPGNLTPLKN